MKMHRIYIPALLLIALLPGCETEHGTDPVLGISNVPVWEIQIPHEQYVSLLNNKWSEEQAGAAIHIGGKEHRGFLEAQGAGSRYLSDWSYKVELEPGTTINGLSVFNLSAQTWDKTRVRTELCNELYTKAGFIGFLSFPAYIRVNKNNAGLYIMIERVDTEYFQRHPEYPLHELIKVGFEAKFTFKEGALKLDKSFDKKYPDSKSLTYLADFFKALDETPSSRIFSGLNKYLDIPQYLRYHALSSLINHKDGFTNNFYLYRPTAESPYQIIPWDYDQAFSFTANTEYAGENGIFEKLIENDSCAAMYKQQLQILLDSVMTEEFCFPVIDANADRIAKAYRLSPTLGGRGLDVYEGAARLKSYITERRDYFLTLINN